jgi:hypothetical protein
MERPSGGITVPFRGTYSTITFNIKRKNKDGIMSVNPLGFETAVIPGKGGIPSGPFIIAATS